MNQIIVTHSGVQRIMPALLLLRSEWILAMFWRCGMVSALRNALLFGSAIRQLEISALMYVYSTIRPAEIM